MIVLADCNNFYASCERVFNPKLKNKPVIVLSNNDGCVIARSNESKALGIKMGEPVFKIKDIILKHHVYVFSTNFALYGDMSSRVMSILRSESPSIEIYSIDEAFMDFSSISNYSEVAYKIKEKVFNSTGIPVSFGLAKTKTLAKVANHIAKKYTTDNIFIMDENSLDILKKFPISDIWGIGRAHSKMLNYHGIKTAYQFIKLDENWVQKKMSINGLKVLKELKGIECFSIDQYPKRKKSICTSRTFSKDTNDINYIEQSISNYGARCAEKLRKEKSCAQYIGVFLNVNRFKNYDNYHNGFRATMFDIATNDTMKIIEASKKLLSSIYKKNIDYKKAGVIIGDIVPENQVQLNLFNNFKKDLKAKELFKSLDSINRKMGRGTVKFLAQGVSTRSKIKQENLSPCYTTKWEDILKINC
jgi:DNA polymerase V